MRKLIDQNTRKIFRQGRASLAITLPVVMLKALGWQERQKVVATKVRGGILIKDWKK